MTRLLDTANKVRRSLDDLERAYGAGQVSVADYRRRSAALEAKLAELDARKRSAGSHVARLAGEACISCGSAPEPGRRRCATHAEEHREKEAARRDAMKARRRCVVCGQRAAAGRTLCVAHGEYYRQRNRVAG